MRKDFSNIAYKSVSPEVKATPSVFTTAEQIELKSHYTVNDNQNLEHLNFGAGMPPFLRGPYSSMYVQSPWTIRQ